MIDIIENPASGATASVAGDFGEASTEILTEGHLTPSPDSTDESDTLQNGTDPSGSSSGYDGYQRHGYIMEPEYPKRLNGSVVQWTELTSRIFYGDQTELGCDGNLTDRQMRDFANYSIGVGHDGFDARLLSEAFLSSGRIDHAIQLMAYHENYLEVFLRTHHFLLRGDGPLPFTYRHYIAIMAAARFQCTYLMELQKREFLYQAGDPQWLKGLEFAPQKLTSLYNINKMMAHRPWALKKEDFLHLTKKAGWSLSEVVHAVVLLAHFHSLSSFIHGCGITPEVDFDKGHAYLDPGTFNVIGNGTSPLPGIGTTTGGLGTDSISTPASLGLSGDHGAPVTASINKIDKTEISASPSNKATGLLRTAAKHMNSNATATTTPPLNNPTGSPSPAKKTTSEVELLLATMKNLSEMLPIEDPEERKKRFETVASSDDTHEKENVLSNTVPANGSLPPEVSPFVCDPDFSYEDFVRRGQVADMHTFRIQDYSWEEHGFSLVNRLYADVGGYLDDKFKVAQNMTYYTMGGRPHVDTTKFRIAVWNYIQCLYGIRHDDYDYGEVNQLLERPLKAYIKTVCCYPERITKADYDNVMREFKHSEKVHVNLMAMEAKTQAELLYALRTIMRFIL